MTARLTDDEIRKLRYYRDACVHSPEWRLTFMGIPMDTALDRLLDELLEHRAAEESQRKTMEAFGVKWRRLDDSGFQWTKVGEPVTDIRHVDPSYSKYPKDTDR